MTFGFYNCSAPAKGKRRGGPGGLNKLCNVTPELQAIVGQPAMPRTEVPSPIMALHQNCLDSNYFYTYLEKIS